MNDEQWAQIDALVKEAIELRFAQHLPAPESGPSEVLQSLSTARQALDRVEHILVQLVRARASASRIHQQASAVASDAWDERSRATASSSRSSGYVGPRERYADINLDTMAQKRAERAAEHDVSRLDEALDVVRILHRGIDGLRQDHHRVLGALSFESRLER